MGLLFLYVYRTYEELRQISITQNKSWRTFVYRTYEELRHFLRSFLILLVILPVYRTYEELRHAKFRTVCTSLS